MDAEHELRISKDARASLRRVLSRTVTENQLLILSSIDGRERSLSSFLRELSESYKIPLSTLKLSLKVLRESGLVALVGIRGSDCSSLALTDGGETVIDLLLCDENGEYDEK